MAQEVLAELPATVLSLAAAPGSSVRPGDVLLVLESMKMEIPVLAEEQGTVVRCAVDAGSTVGEGDLLMVVDRAASPAA